MPKRTKEVVEEPAIESPDPEILELPVTNDAPEDVVIFKRSHFYSAVTVLAFAVGVLVGYVVWGYGPAGATSTAGVPVTAEPRVTRYDIPSLGYPAIGPEDAPITIVEFSDYQCPYCRRWHEQVYEPLLAAYPGKIRFVYRHLPLTSIHPDAFSAAQAAMCAGEQGAYWSYHEKLFGSELLGSNIYTQYAQELSLNLMDFDTCMTQQTHRAKIEADSDFAVNLGVRSTPTFFINGIAIVGAQPLDVFQQVIDQELAGEIPQ